MSHTGWHNSSHSNGQAVSKAAVIIIALIALNVYFNNIVLKIVFAAIFWGVWAAIIYAVALKPIYKLLLKLFNKVVKQYK